MLKPVPLTVLDADSVVNAPAAAAVPPMAGGLARYVLKPVPLTVLLALNVVNAPVLAVVAPTLALLIVPPLTVGLVSVLLVRVCVASVPTRVVLASGIVNVRVVLALMLAASNLNLRVESELSWIVNRLSTTASVGSVVMVTKAVPVLLIATNWSATAPLKAGNLSKPAVIRSSSARILADVAADPVDGNEPCV